MAKHHTSNTVSVTKWCGRCKKKTPHRVDSHRESSCLDCITKPKDTLKFAGPVVLPRPCTCNSYRIPHLHEQQIREGDAAWKAAYGQ